MMRRGRAYGKIQLSTAKAHRTETKAQIRGVSTMKRSKHLAMRQFIGAILAIIIVLTSNNYNLVSVEAATNTASTQQNSIAILNYLTELTQEINASKGSRIYLEDVYSELINNTYPNAVDTMSQVQLESLLDTIESYRMIDVKRERLEYIYEQNQAQALREAIPNPLSILNVIQSKNLLHSLTSIIYTAVDSVSSYNSYKQQAELQYLQDGWELDDEESETLHESRKEAFSYMLSMVRDNNLSGDLALNENSVEEFVSWKNNSNVVRRIAFLESNKSTYQAFGPYWLLLAESYYDNGDYDKCLTAISTYEKTTTRIYRKDYDYAKILPDVILAAKENYSVSKYVETARTYCKTILDNTDNSDWLLRYFVAETYLDLYALTNVKTYLNLAYDIAFDNVNYLLDEQKSLNDVYLADIAEKETPKDATDREKSEIKEYNNMLKETRKTELPPVSEALYVNCDLLFALADECDIDDAEKAKIENILYGDGADLFLTESLNSLYKFSESAVTDAADLEAGYDKTTLKIPAVCVSDNAKIKVTVSGSDEITVIDDWTIQEVDRKDKNDLKSFEASYSSENAKEVKYNDGDKIIVEISPKEGSCAAGTTFEFKAVAGKFLFFFDDTNFERVS